MKKIIEFVSETHQTNFLSIEMNKLIDFEFPSGLKMIYIFQNVCFNKRVLVMSMS